MSFGRMIGWAALSLGLVLPAALLGLRLQLDGVALFWPTAGVVVGLMLRAPVAARFPVLAGAAVALVLANMTQDRTATVITVFVLGNIVQALAIALALDRVAAHPFRFDTITRVAAFAAVCALAAALTGLVVAPALHAIDPRVGLFDLWRTWFGAQVVGLLTFTPAVICAGPIRSGEPRQRLSDHLALVFYLITAVTVTSLLRASPEPKYSLLLALAMLGPLVWWIRQRTSAGRAAVALLTVAGVTIWDASHANFLHPTVTETRVFLVLSAGVLLTLGAWRQADGVATARHQAGGIWRLVVSAPALFLTFYSAYLLGAGFAQALAIIPGTGISLWPPSGLYLGTLLVSRFRTWPWWVVAATAAELTANALWFHNPPQIALMFCLGNTAEAITGAWIIGRIRGVPFQLENLRDVLAMLMVGAGLAPVLSATVGGATLALTGGLDFAQGWSLLWIGDATGVLIVAPLTLVVLRGIGAAPDIAPVRVIEAVILALVFIAVALGSLGGYLPFAYIIMPPLIWAALRFDFTGAVASSTVLALMTAAFTLTGVSPFALGVSSVLERHVMLQLFLAISAISALLVAAISRQHRVALDAVRQSNAELERRVAERTAGLRHSEARYRGIFERAGTGIVLRDLEGRITSCNPAFARMLGYTENELLGLTFGDLVDPEDREAVDAMFRRVARHETDFAETNTRYRHKSGRPIRAHKHLSVLRDAAGLPTGYITLATDMTAEWQAEERQRLLLLELAHRGKNLLGVIQSIAKRTLDGRLPPEQARDAFVGRIQALAHTYSALTDERFEGAALRDVITAELAPYGARATIEGPRLVLSPKVAQTFTLIAHELATNAVKYGALSNTKGSIVVRWQVADAPDGDPRFTFEWCETGGPPAVPPQRQGFGMTIVTAVAGASFGCTPDLDFGADGFGYRLEAPLSKIGHLVEARPLRSRITGGLLRQFHDAWAGLPHRDGRVPDLNDFPRDKFAVGGRLILAELEGNVMRFLEVGRQLTGRLDPRQDSAAAVFDRTERHDDVYRRCAEGDAPCHETFQFDFHDGESVAVELLLVPLSGAGGRRYVLGLVGFTGDPDPRD